MHSQILFNTVGIITANIIFVNTGGSLNLLQIITTSNNIGHMNIDNAPKGRQNG